MNRNDFDRACKLADLAGGGVGITLTAEELRWLLDGYNSLLDALKRVMKAIEMDDIAYYKQVVYWKKARAAIRAAEESDRGEDSD